MAKPKTHRSELERLAFLEQQAELGGGQKAVDRHHERRKLTARERLNLLFDPDSFVEVNKLAESQSVDFGMQERKVPGDGVVTGYGTIEGRMVFAYAQDVTVLGGSVGTIHGQKICRIMDEAIKVKAPLVALNDSGGGRLHEGFFASKGVAGMFYRNTAASGLIPQITGMMGSSAGVAVYSPALTDFIVMVKGQSHMVITGPAIIREVTGEDISLEELGGAKVHSEITGQAHLVADSDQECIEIIKKLLGYLPSNNEEPPPVVASTDDPERVDDTLEEMVPADFKKSYDMRRVILRVVDKEDFYEILPRFATNIIIGFARLDGNTVGIVANQPRVKAGCLDVNASDKAARFIRFCDAFNIPLINFVDVPGYFPGVTQEHAGIIRHGAKMLYAYAEATVPKIAVITRKAYGGAYIAMSSKHLRSDVNYAWPNAEIAVMGPEGAVNVVNRKEIEAAEDAEGKRAELVQEYREKYATPYIAAARGYIDAVIVPHETRPRIIESLAVLENKRDGLPPKKHGNIPL